MLLKHVGVGAGLLCRDARLSMLVHAVVAETVLWHIAYKNKLHEAFVVAFLGCVVGAL